MATRRLGALAALAILATLVPGPARAETCPGAPQAHTATNGSVTSFDGTAIAITEFRPADVCAANPVPVVLTLHGWSGSRHTEVSQEQDLLDRGYAVVAIDSRGNGESEGMSLVHHPSQEVKDFQKVLDHIYDATDYVVKDDSSGIDKDVRVGARGGSYGGGFQLMLEAFDDRLDAIMPDDTWHDLPQSLAPNGGAIKLFVSLLYATGKQNKRLDPRLDQWFAETMATNEVPAAARENFLESSPKTYVDELDVPAFFTQGMVDTLFPLNEAVGNYKAVRATGNPAWLVGRNSGHTYPGLQPTGLNAPARPVEGCFGSYPGALAGAKLDFLDAFLKQDATARARLDAVPSVSLTTESGDCIQSASWPPQATIRRKVQGDMVIPATGSQFIPLLTATQPTTIAGIPRFTGLLILETDDRFYFSLAVRRGSAMWIVDDQVTGVHTPLTGGGAVETDISFGAVATTLLPGDELYLRVDGTNEQFVLNGNRKPGVTAFYGSAIDLPILSQ